MFKSLSQYDINLKNYYNGNLLLLVRFYLDKKSYLFHAFLLSSFGVNIEFQFTKQCFEDNTVKF